MNVNVEITNQADIKLLFDSLNDKIKHKNIIKILRKGGVILKRTVKNEAPMRSGTLKRSIGIISGKNKQYPSIFIGPRTGKPPGRGSPTDGWYAPFITLGGNVRIAKKGSIKRRGKSFGVIKKNDFVTRGTSAGESAAIQAFNNEITKQLQSI